jgi:hypothetical protein
MNAAVAPAQCEECIARCACVQQATARLDAKRTALAGYPTFTRERLTDSLRRDVKYALQNLAAHELECGALP